MSRLEEQFGPEYEDLLITVAIHAELQGREAGGNQAERVPTLRELAEEVITPAKELCAPGSSKRTD